ncbi:MAG TPA: class I SAM-dependent methyltransferase [Bacillota bacterium]|nr:class I SAM-dependent methyltransferase [Bacillota bacterium]
MAIGNQNYWDYRGGVSYRYKNETFYTITPIPYYHRRRALLLELLKPLIECHAVKDVCDFGCGDGWYIQHFGQQYPDKRYWGVDISSSMIERARLAAPFAEFQVSQAGFDFTNAFDLVYSVAVFAHIQDKMLSTIFQNIRMTLRKGCKFALFEQTGPVRREGETWIRRTPREYTEFASNCGFDIEISCLITFPAHRFFEKYIAPMFYRWFAGGKEHHERCICANRSKIFRILSTMFLNMSRNPIRRPDCMKEGNALFILKRA